MPAVRSDSPPQYGTASAFYSGPTAPVGIAVDAAGVVYWANYDTGQLLSMSSGAYSPTVILNGLIHPSAVAVDPQGHSSPGDLVTLPVGPPQFTRSNIYNEWAAWPLALIGIWLGVASCLGFGCKEFPNWVDGLGVLAGLGLIAISVSTWIGAPGDVTRVVGSFAAIAYIAWAVAFGRMLWGTTEVTHRFMGRLDSVRGYV